MRPGVILPLYIYPGADWRTVLNAKSSFPNVQFLAIINPANGVGRSKDQSYESGINELRNAGLIVLGYVSTRYASRKIEEVTFEIDAYKSWYSLDGIMFDEMSPSPEEERYYSFLGSYAKKEREMKLTVGNPGTIVPQNYSTAFDILNIYEDAGMPSPERLSKSPFPGERLSAIAYGIKTFDPSLVKSVANAVRFIYLTDGLLPNPYGKLPSFFENLVVSLSDLR